MWGRQHLPFFREFDNFLSKFFDVNVTNYNTTGDQFCGGINTIKDISNFQNTPSISDTDYIIENSTTGEIKVISVTEYFNSYVSHFAKSECCSTVLLSHFSWTNTYHWMLKERATKDIHKVRPWVFLTQKPIDHVALRERRSQIKSFNDKLFFRGSGIDSYRKSVMMLHAAGFTQPLDTLTYSEYLKEMINSKIGLSYYQDLDKYSTPHDHPGEFCYRDIEYMAVGLPYIRIEYKDNVHDPIIPNYHYISIPRETAYCAYQQAGDQGVRDVFIDRYNEVLNDEEFLKYISMNQTNWYNQNMTKPNIHNLTFDALKLNDWLI